MSDPRNQPLRAGIIGCGNIAGQYLGTFENGKEVAIVGVCDLDEAKARAFGNEHRLPVYSSREELLADPAIEAVVNLTIHHAHYEVTRAALEAGKHVYSEKPLAMQPAQAHKLVGLAEQKGLLLSCAPITYLGEAQQTLGKRVRSGELGKIRVIYAEVNHGRIETWHPNPGPFYEVGPMLDVGVYPVTLATAFLGPVRQVRAVGKQLLPERQTKNGEAFTFEKPDFFLALLEFESGAIMRLTANFYVMQTVNGRHVVEFHGDAGTAGADSWCDFACPVRAAPYGEPLREVPNDFDDPEGGIVWSRGLFDFVAAIRQGRPPRATGAHAAHVLDVLTAIDRSAAEEGARQSVTSDFPLPPPWEVTQA